ncbi:MAG: translation elongation factor Ts [Chloroflexi bacterium]|nr:translation elongation factor Ts [Chloroflexota bacterium]
MQITPQMVKELRQLTNAGVMDCKKALEQCNGDFEAAAAILKEKGLAIAAKKADRETKEGLIGYYVHTGSKMAALVEVNCETDFVAKTDIFKDLVHDLAMQIVAARPRFVRIEDIPADVLEAEKEAYRAEIADTGKPERVIAQIMEGKLAKFYEENCLMEQLFIKDGATKIQDLLTAAIAKLGENIVVRRFVRYELGEQQ